MRSVKNMTREELEKEVRFLRKEVTRLDTLAKGTDTLYQHLREKVIRATKNGWTNIGLELIWEDEINAKEAARSSTGS